MEAHPRLKLHSPESYYEIPGRDARIAVQKLLDVQFTMGMAERCLTRYELIGENRVDLESCYEKCIQLQHAIFTLSSAFEILLQAPWMFYRAWQAYNRNGKLFISTNWKKKKKDIQRLTENWARKSQKECTYDKLVRYLKVTPETQQLPWVDFLELFDSQFIKIGSRPFSIQTLFNTIKHRGALQFTELTNHTYTTYTISDDNEKAGRVKCYTSSTPQEPTVYLSRRDDGFILMDLEYEDESFFASDYMGDPIYGMHTIYEFCINYKNALKILFGAISNHIMNQVVLNTAFDNLLEQK